MEINKLIEANQKESIGKYFFSKATTFALNKEFGKSYEYFKEGLDIITCDCVRGGWLKAYAESDKKLFDDINIKYMPHFEYFFVKAYMMSYEEDKKSLYSALDAIDKYLILQDDDYGHYVRGKILLGLEESREAFDCFYSASSFSKNQRLLYRLGRTKEQLLGENGLEELFNSFIKNPLSACCARLLKKYMKERGETLAIEEGVSNLLITAFNNDEDEWHFQRLYEKLLESQLENENDLPFEIEDNTPTINSFVQCLLTNSDIFIDEKNAYNDYDDSNDSNDYYEKPDYERDNFDALTDGQYGDYDDWRESGGDMDSLRDSMGY